MKTISKLMIAFLMLTVFSCSDNRESIAKNYLYQQLSNQSRGALVLSSFKKMNGYKGDKNDSYVLEWEMVVRSNAELWKIRTDDNFYWRNFVCELNIRDAEKTSMAWHSGYWNSAQSPVHFQVGKQVKLNGNVTMIDSEKGWIVNDFKITRAQDLN